MRFEGKSKEYNEGYEAFLQRMPERSNPYQADFNESMKRLDEPKIWDIYYRRAVDWYRGYTEAKNYLDS